MKDFDANKDYRRHIWMVQSRDSESQVAEYKAAGIDAGENEWTDSLSKPVWGARAIWLANELENTHTITRIVKAEVSA